MDGRVRGILCGVCLMAALALAGTAYAASATDDEGHNHVDGNNVSVSGDGTHTFTNAVSGANVRVDLTSGSSAVFNNTVHSDVVMKIMGSGTTTFEQGISIGDSANPIPGEDHNLFILGGNNTFKGQIISGSLETEVLGSKTGIVNQFKEEVNLWGQVVTGLPGYAVILGSGTNTFEKNVTTDHKSALFINTITTFNETLDVGNGRVIIGYDDDVLDRSPASDAEKQSLSNTTTEVILATDTSRLNTSQVLVAKGGTLTVQGDASITGYLTVRDGGTITTAADTTLTLSKGLSLHNATGTFNGKIDDSSTSGGISINGTSNVVFKDTITTTDGLEIMDGAARTEFQAAIVATCLAVDTEPGRGSSVNVFKGDITLNGVDSDIVYSDKEFSLIIGDGTNTFEKNVTTGDKSAAFLKSTTTFYSHLNAGTGDIELGWSPMAEVQEENDEGFTSEFYQSSPGTLILAAKDGSAPSITAGTVTVYNRGVLQLESDATINGDIAFASGGIFSTDAKNLLTVNGNATIAEGALANIRNAGSLEAIGKTIMTASAIDGGFTPHGASLYTVETRDNAVVITGLNRVEDVLDDVNISTANSAASAAMTTQVLADASASKELQESLANAVQNITVLAATDPGLAKVATMQLFGENVLAASTATQTTAESFSTGISSHQIQLRDQASAGSASATSGSGYASINPRYYRHNDTANRIWAAGFGAWTNQRDRGNQAGYKYDAGGFILGYDREYGNFVFGVSGAYSNGDIDNNEGSTKTDIETLNVGLYGSYNPSCGLFVDANVGFGYAWNDVHTNAVGGGSKKGKYRNTSFQMGGNIGYTFNFGNNVRFVPTVGLQYTHIHQEAWQESVSAGSALPANRFEKTNSDFVSIPVAVRLNKSFDFGNGVRITPELRAAYIFEAKKNQPKVRMGYVGANATTTLYGIDSGRSRGLVGAGVKAQLTRNVDVFVDYNFAFRKKYTSHNIMAGLGLSF